ncbi:MAG TPA: N-acetylmuramoyl-L-alanine amidase [Acidimicrobiales bacterium]|nr:N-acetylmuramoyl-L-alanine amidase [Acidimicrobiales bacterium]
MKAWVAVLFVASVLAAAVVSTKDDGPGPVQAVLQPSTTLAPPSSVPETTTTAPAPVNPVTTLPPAPPVPAEQAKVLVSASGVVLPIQAKEGAGWKVTTPCGRTVVAQGTPVGPAQVVLDPGHGGAEPGAIGPNGLTEKALNLAVAEQAKAALQRAGVTVVMTRTADYRMTLESRAQVARAVHPNAFVSVHHNAEPDGPFPRPGTETYYQVASADSKRLAGLLYEEVVKALSQYSVGWVADTDAGAKYRKNTAGDDYYGILRRTHGVVGALAELSFLTSPPEADLLSRADVQHVEGEAVARGILRYLTTKDPGSGFTEPYPRSSPAGNGGGASNCVDPAL